MYHFIILAFTTLITIVHGQRAGNFTPELHPSLVTQNCTFDFGCTTLDTSLVLEVDQRALRSVANPAVLCYNGTWDTTLCPDPVTCAQNCAPDGVDYETVLSSDGSALTIKLKQGSPRLYLLGEDQNKYQMFYLKNQEFTYDVDMSLLPCGTNGALYFISMEEDGGSSSTNTAGAAYGTGYCDAQCPTYNRWINGKANLNNTSGACCAEMDVWEANKMAAAYTPHSCSKQGFYECDSAVADDCNVCDKGGCDFNSYRMGNTTFLGPDQIVDTNRTFTVVTQFLTSDNTSTGDLTEIRRIYLQDGQVIQNSKVNVPGLNAYDSITQDYCVDEKAVFNSTDDFTDRGGFTAMSKSFDQGMVLSMSIWADTGSYMLWLDGVYPIDSPTPYAPGVERGSCGVNESIPANLEAVSDPAVTFSNLKFGDIGSTYSVYNSTARKT